MPNRKPVHGPAVLLPALMLLAVLAAAPAAATDDAPGPMILAPITLDPARVGWSEIRMTASKLFLTAEARLSLRTIPGVAVLPDLLPVDDDRFTPLMPGTEVVELLYETRAIGRRSRLTLLMDPVSGTAFQRTQYDQDGKMRQRTYRFGIEGAYQRTLKPETASERSLPPSRWTHTGESFRAYPALPGTQPLIEPTGLLYAVSAASLDQPGDTIDVLVFRRRDTQIVRITVLPSREVSVHYDELWPTGTVQRTGKVQALRLSLEGLPRADARPDDDHLELLGLGGKLELLLDPQTRAPLQLSGNVKIVGTVTLRLAAVRAR